MPVPALGVHWPAVEGDGIGAFAFDLFLLCLFIRFRLTLPGFNVHQDFDRVRELKSLPVPALPGLDNRWEAQLSCSVQQNTPIRGCAPAPGAKTATTEDVSIPRSLGRWLETDEE